MIKKNECDKNKNKNKMMLFVNKYYLPTDNIVILSKIT